MKLFCEALCSVLKIVSFRWDMGKRRWYVEEGRERRGGKRERERKKERERERERENGRRRKSRRRTSYGLSMQCALRALSFSPSSIESSNKTNTTNRTGQGG